MSARSLSYWLACSAFAFMATEASSSVTSGESTIGMAVSGKDALSIVAVPEPGRAAILFIGIMAMAFTYRKVWLNWKRSS